jgi:molecular chaperone HscA
MARLEVEFNVDENNLLRVSAREATTGISQEIRVEPSHGLTDEDVERMLLEALDHGEQDFERRRLVDARVEGERLVLATDKGLASDADLLADDERARVERALSSLRSSVTESASASAIRQAIDELDRVTHDWAGRRMNRAVAAAIAGKSVSAVEKTVEHAEGVEAHLARHQREPAA